MSHYEANEVKARVSLVSIASAKIPLTKKRDEFWGCCPFHKENTPSFSINEVSQQFYCFGCGAKGDVFSFVERTQGLSFSEALDYLGSLSGLHKATKTGQETDKAFDAAVRSLLVKKKTTQELQLALKPPPLTLPQGTVPLGDPRVADINLYALKRGFSPKLLNQLNLGGCFEGRCFGRLILPVYRNGSLVFWQAREALARDRPKYLNPRKEETLCSPSDVLFNADEASRHDNIVICEGIFSAMRVGKNAVATLGNKISQTQLDILEQIKKTTLTLFFDANTWQYKTDGIYPASPQHAPVYQAAVQLFKRFKTIRVLKLEDGQDDPDTFGLSNPDALDYHVKYGYFRIYHPDDLLPSLYPAPIAETSTATSAPQFNFQEATTIERP